MARRSRGFEHRCFENYRALPIRADCLNWAGAHGFLAEGFIASGCGLGMNEGITAVADVMTPEDMRRGLAAEITVNAILHDEELPGNIFRDLFSRCKSQTCHKATCCVSSSREIRQVSQIQRGISAKGTQENA